MSSPEYRNEPLPPGLYEQVVDRGIECLMTAISEGEHEVKVEPLEAGDSHQSLADYLRRVIRQALDALTGEERLERQLTLCNQILGALEGGTDERALPSPARR